MPSMPQEQPLDELLRQHFGFSAFKPGQRKLIEAVLARRDVLGVLPTAGGKSLTYQLPALLLDGVTLVISPLIALMKDQVDAFNRRGKGLAVALHSNLTPREIGTALSHLDRRQARLLYVAPERVEFDVFRKAVTALQPKLLVIDEAHCVSMWGHDFRPSYLALKEFAAALRPCPVLALTATATPATRAEIVTRLGLQSPLTEIAPFDRPNLRFEVHPCPAKEKLPRLRRILNELSGASSQIVYVGRRKDSEEIAADLNNNGFGAVAYHAGMNANERRTAQDAWLAGKKPIAVATVAFGLGIDKPDVRAVIHYQHPASLEAYYQEAGRAGRDGKPARCIVLFSGKDTGLANFFIQQRYPDAAQMASYLQGISPDGTLPEDLPLMGDPAMSDEQRNVAFVTLLDQNLIYRDEAGNYRPAKAAAWSLSLRQMNARKNADYRRLEAMVAYANDTQCHRAVLLRYFGEKTQPGYRCGNCSACSDGRTAVVPAPAPTATRTQPRQPRPLPSGDIFWRSPKRAFTTKDLLARKVPRERGLLILQLVGANEQRFTAPRVAVILTAHDAGGRLKAEGLHALPQWGKLSSLSYDDALADVLAMWAKGYLRTIHEKDKKLCLTDKGRAALGGSTSSGASRAEEAPAPWPTRRRRRRGR
jgi:ATP-dependent DNA helicase RecQ